VGRCRAKARTRPTTNHTQRSRCIEPTRGTCVSLDAACAATLLNWGCGRESSTFTPHSHPVFSYHVRNTRVSGQRLFKWQSIWLLLLTLGFSIVILIGVLDTRLETVASA
jgi:hypothetical protein